MVYLVALQDIEPSQLLLFVQSFGIPVKSMSQLLVSLDHVVTSDPTILDQAVEDKSYMAQLIDIQHMRGAKGGERFRKMLSDEKPFSGKHDRGQGWELLSDQKPNCLVSMGGAKGWKMLSDNKKSLVSMREPKEKCLGKCCEMSNYLQSNLVFT